MDEKPDGLPEEAWIIMLGYFSVVSKNPRKMAAGLYDCLAKFGYLIVEE